MFFSGRAPTPADARDLAAERCAAAAAWFQSCPADAPAPFATLFRLEFLYTVVLVLSPSRRAPALDQLQPRRLFDYAAAFDEKWAHSADVSDAQSFPDNSDSDDDDDDVDNGSFFDGPHDAAHDDDDDSASIGDESDGLSDHDADDGPRAHQLELRPDTAPSAPVLHHHQLPPFTNQWELLASVSPDDLDDNGVSVEYRQRKIWEAWVVSKANLP
ncbi:hypothetical protein LOZ43_001379 [Ophidiomyces ophidiicola]|nr:hypothetical protein LOZ43_001379 [Ophidiomyces ophidiicola]